MMIVLDTNIVIRYLNAADPAFARVSRALQAAVQSREEPCICAQSVFEFWVVATRPIEVNGLGLTPPEARAAVDRIREALTMLPDPQDLLVRWLELCTLYEVKGRAAHDARIAAWMEAHGLRRLMTLNPGDFARYPEIECVVPT